MVGKGVCPCRIRFQVVPHTPELWYNYWAGHIPDQKTQHLSVSVGYRLVVMIYLETNILPQLVLQAEELIQNLLSAQWFCFSGRSWLNQLINTNYFEKSQNFRTTLGIMFDRDSFIFSNFSLTFISRQECMVLFYNSNQIFLDKKP
jgi:hypothetical protein